MDTYTIDETMALLGVKSRRTVAKLIKANELSGYRVGRSVKIYGDSITQYKQRHGFGGQA